MAHACVQSMTLSCIVRFQNYFGLNDHHDMMICRVEEPCCKLEVQGHRGHVNFLGEISELFGINNYHDKTICLQNQIKVTYVCKNHVASSKIKVTVCT